MFLTTYDDVTRTWSGPKTIPVFNPNVSAAQVILNILKKNPNKIAQISDNNGIQMKNSEIRMKTIRAAEHLRHMGYGKNDIIGIVAKNHHHLAPIVFAAFSIAAPVNPMDPNFTTDEMAHMMQLTKPKLIFCDADNITTVREALKQLHTSVPIFTFDGKVDGARQVDELFIDTKTDINNFIPADIGNGAQHPLVMICSSGTTGHSKAVCLSHAAALEQLANIFDVTSDDVMMAFSSLYWLSGFGTLMVTTLCEMTRIITTEVFQPELMLQIVEKHKVSVTITPPNHLALLLQSKALTATSLSSLVKYNCGGSIVPQELCNRIKHFLPNSIYVGYGMSEAAGIVSLNYPDPRPGSVGLLVNGITAKIINDTGNRCGVGKDGEICLLLQHPFLGYYGDVDSTNAAIDSDGWLHSGDIGHFDEDGYLFIVDRIKDIIKHRGYQISPSEIEDVILKHRGVTSVCVVGIPDVLWTDLPAAVVLRSDDFDVTEREIMDSIKNTMSDYKQLRGGVYFVDCLPLTPSGKIVRRKVKEMAIEMYNQKSKA